MKVNRIVLFAVCASLFAFSTAPVYAQEQGTRTQSQVRQQLKDPSAEPGTITQQQKRYQKKSQQRSSQGTGSQSRKGSRNKGG